MATKQEMLDAVESAIYARLTGGAVDSYSINGRNIQYMPIQELNTLRDTLQKEIAASRSGGSRTYVAFKDPS
jgi:hypothetical protein